VCLMFTMTLLVGSAGAQHTVDDIDYDTVSNPDNLVRLLRDLFDQLRSTWIRLTPQTTAPTAQEGKVYYNDTANQLYFSADGSTWTALAAGSGNSLGAAYTLGSKIDADTDVVEIEVADGSNNVALLIDHDEAQNDNDAVQITNAADATTAVSLQIDGTAGYDIQGTGDSWNISIAGAASLVGITNTAADCLWDDTYDMSWDTSLDQLLFEDNAVLGIGGAHDAAGDVTFKWDATNLLIEANADNTGQIRMGSTNAIDFAVYGSTNTNIVLFDVSEAIVESNGWAWVIQDDDDLRFGDSDEFVVEYDEDGTDNLVVVAANANDAMQIGDCTTGTDFIMVGSAAADNTTHKAWFDASGNTNEGIMKFGVDDHGLDVEFYGETASQLVTWDQSADTWYFGDDAEGVDVYLNADTTGDFFLWDESDEALEGVGVQLHLDDASPLQLGSTAGDVYLQFDGTNFLIDASTASEGMLIGDATSGFDVAYRFATAGEFRTDYDADFINLTDDMDLRFGTGASADGDFMISSDSSNVLNISQVVADTGTITIGANGTDVPLSWYAETTGDFVRMTGDDFQLEDVSLCLGEGTQIQFGDNLGTGDVTMACASNLLTIGQVVAGTGAVALGANDAGVDLTFYGDTTGNSATWDASDDRFELVSADITMDNASQLFDAVNTGTKVVFGTPITIEFRPTAAETLTYTVPAGYDLIVTDAYGWKIAASGSGANDDINLQHNDGSAANIFDTEELDAVGDKARFAFDNLDDAENEIEATETLDCVTQEASSVDCIVIVNGYLKTAD
jgi:hypothetical protein